VFGSFAGVCGQPTFLGAFLVFPDLPLLGFECAGVACRDRVVFQSAFAGAVWIVLREVAGARFVMDRPGTFGSTQTLVRKPFPHGGVGPAGA